MLNQLKNKRKLYKINLRRIINKTRRIKPRWH